MPRRNNAVQGTLHGWLEGITVLPRGKLNSFERNDLPQLMAELDDADAINRTSESEKAVGKEYVGRNNTAMADKLRRMQDNINEKVKAVQASSRKLNKVHERVTKSRHEMEQKQADQTRLIVQTVEKLIPVNKLLQQGKERLEADFLVVKNTVAQRDIKIARLEGQVNNLLLERATRPKHDGLESKIKDMADDMAKSFQDRHQALAEEFAKTMEFQQSESLKLKIQECNTKDLAIEKLYIEVRQERSEAERKFNETSELRQKIQEHEMKSNNLISSYNKLVLDMKERNKKTEEYKEKYRTALNELEAANDKIGAFDEVKKGQEIQLRKVQKNFNDEINRSSEQLTDAKSRMKEYEAEIQDLRWKMATLQEELASSKQSREEMSKIEAECEDRRTRIEMLTNERHELQNALEVKGNDWMVTNAELQELRCQVAAKLAASKSKEAIEAEKSRKGWEQLSELNSELQHQIYSKNTEIWTLKADKTNLNSQIMRLLDSHTNKLRYQKDYVIEPLQQEIHEKMQAHAEAVSAHDKLGESMQQLEQKLQRQQELQEELETTLQKHQQELASERQTSSQLAKEKEFALSSLTQEKQKQNSEKMALEDELQKVKDTRDKLENDLSSTKDAEKDRASHEKQMQDELRKSLEGQHNKISELHSNIDTLQQEKTSLEKQKASIIDENSQLLQKIKGAWETANILVTEKASLQDSLDDAEGLNERLCLQIEDLNEKVSSLNNEIDALIISKKMEVDRMTETIRKNADEQFQFSTRILAYEANLEELKEERSALQLDLDESESKIDNLEQIIADNEVQALFNLEQHNEVMALMQNNGDKKVKDLQGQQENLEKNLSELQQQNKELENRSERLQLEKTDLLAANLTLTTDLKDRSFRFKKENMDLLQATIDLKIDLREKSDSFQQERTDLEQANLNLRTDLAFKSDDFERGKMALLVTNLNLKSDLRDQSDRFEKEKGELLSENLNLKTNLQVKSDEFEEEKAKLQKANLNLKTAMKDNSDSFQIEKMNLLFANQNLKADLKDASDDFQKRVAGLQQANLNLKTDLNVKSDDFQKEIAVLQQACLKLKNDLKDKSDKFQREKTDLQEANLNLKGALGKISEELQREKEALEKRSEELQAANSYLSKWKVANNNLELTRDRLRADLDTVEKNLQNQIDAANDQENAREIEKTELMTSNKEMTREIDELVLAKETWTSEKTKMVDMLRQRANQNQSLVEDVKRLHVHITTLTAESDRLKQESQQYAAALERLEIKDANFNQVFISRWCEKRDAFYEGNVMQPTPDMPEWEQVQCQAIQGYAQIDQAFRKEVKKVNRLKKEMTNLEEELKDFIHLKKELANLENESERLQTITKNLTLENQNLLREKEMSQHQAQEATKRYNDLQVDYADIEQERKAAKSAIASAEEKYMAYRLECISTEDGLKMQNRALESKATLAIGDTAQCKAENSKLVAQVDELKNEVKRDKEDLKAAKTENATLCTEIRKLTEDLGTAQAEKAQLKMENRKLDDDLRNVDFQTANIEVETNKIKENLAAALSERTTLESQAKQIYEDLATANSEKVTSENKVKELEAEINKIREDMATALTGRMTLESQTKQTIANLTIANSDKVIAERRVEELEARALADTNEKEELRNQLAECQRKVEQMALLQSETAASRQFARKRPFEDPHREYRRPAQPPQMMTGGYRSSYTLVPPPQMATDGSQSMTRTASQLLSSSHPSSNLQEGCSFQPPVQPTQMITGDSQPMTRIASEPLSSYHPDPHTPRPFNPQAPPPQTPASSTRSWESSSIPSTPTSQPGSLVPGPRPLASSVEYEFLVTGNPRHGQKISDVSEDLIAVMTSNIETWQKRATNHWAKPSDKAKCVNVRARGYKNARHEDQNDPKTACTSCCAKRIPCVMAYKGRKPVVLPLPTSHRPNDANPQDLRRYVDSTPRENLLLPAD